MDPDQTQSAAIDDTALRRFESAWTDGCPEPIEACLPSQDDECYLPTLEELVQIELEFVWKTCRTRADIARLADAHSLEQYLRRFPSLNRVESVSRLVAQEYQLRHRYGDRPSIDAYRERFPTMKLATRQLETQLQSSRSSLPTLPGYELAEVLGRGAMAVVYRARQERPRRQVALKMLLAGSSADEELVSRFKTEADAVAQLQHPNVVQIHEFIEHNGTAFLSLEFVDGGSLAEYIAGTPQPQRSSTELVLCLAEAIHTAHQQGIIHRDLKPSNILLTAEGTPKVSDFGLAKCLEADSSHTRTGEMLGTPSYMAPEQARGDIRNVDPVTDVYALGAILYELLTGRPPFRGETSWDTISQVLDQEPVSPRQLQPRIDRDLETICLKCLQKEPAKRYPTSELLAEDLQRVLDGEPIRARRVNAMGRFARWCRRRPALAATVAIALLTIGCVAGVAFWRVSQERDRYLAERETAVGNLYDSLVREARSLRLARQVGYRDKVWSRLDEAIGLETPRRDIRELRREAVACMGDFVGRRPQVWKIPNGQEMFVAVAVHPDGEQVAMGIYDGSVSLRRIEDGVEVARLRGHESGVFEVAFSPDGKLLASADDRGLINVWREQEFQWTLAKTFTTAPTLQPDFVKAVSLAFSPDSLQLLAAAKGARQISRWDLGSGQELEPAFVTPPNDSIWRFTLSADGRRLAILTLNESVVLYDFQEDKPLATFSPDQKPAFDVRFSPDGTLLACGTARGVLVYDVQRQQRVLSVLGDHLLSLSFSPDSRWLILPSQQRDVVRLWNIHSNRQVIELNAPVHSALLSPNSRHLVAVSADVAHIFDLRGQGERMVLSGHDQGVTDVVISPDGRWLVSTGGEEKLKVHSTVTGQVVSELQGQFNGLRFSTDGRLLALSDLDAIRFFEFQHDGELSLCKVISHETGLFSSLVFNRDWTRMAIAGTAGVRTWHLAVDTQLDGPPAIEVQASERLMTQAIGSLSINARGDRLAWVDTSGHVDLWCEGERKASRIPDVRGTLPLGTAFLGESDNLAVANVGGELWIVNVADNSVVDHRQPTDNDKDDWKKVHVLPNRDGTRLLFQTDTRVSIFDVDGLTEVVTLPEQRSLPWALRWSHDGKRLAIGQADGTLHLWDLAAANRQLSAIGLGW